MCGTYAAYCRGCRCEACREASRVYKRALRERQRRAEGRTVKPRTYRYEVKCGMRAKYVRGCRCKPCIEALRAYSNEKKRNYDIKNKRGPIKHGAFYAYSLQRCRCGECREANRVHSA